MNRRLAVLAGGLVATLAVVALLQACTAPRDDDSRRALPAYRTFRAEAMATTFVVTLPDRPGAAEAAEEVFAVFRRIDAEMSEWKATSALSAVNRQAGGEAAPVPAELRALLHRGVQMGELTGGAFDVTWAALWGLWDFKAAEPRVPDPGEVACRVVLVDY